ncbi:hypothetical protein ACFV0T_27665 [Streptomyces sp. NPDC059582]|uniref:hypothetical protein n=1 Tax=Streptomyces sp. NPDC059582 TaxID=3346875 RepID=UPI003683FC40
MAASLGVRVAVVCLAGTLAIVTTVAYGGDDRNDSSGTGTAGGLSGGAPDGDPRGGRGDATAGGTPTWTPSPNHAVENGGEDDRDGGSSSTSGAGSSGGSSGGGGPDGSGSAGGGGHIAGFGWLPWGPHSPNTERTPDPESLYDTLGEDPSRCAAVRDRTAENDEPAWKVLHGLAEACLAVQGEGGSWRRAAEDHAAVKDALTDCKGATAYSALGDLLRFHRQHPSTTVRLTASSPGSGESACDFEIVSVSVGDDHVAKPGDVARIRLRGTFFDKGELLSGQRVVFIGGTPVSFPGDQPDHASEPGDRMTFDAFVPTPHEQPSGHPRSVDVTVAYGDRPEQRATFKDAFTLVDPDVSPSPSPVVSSTTAPRTSPSPAPATRP